MDNIKQMKKNNEKKKKHNNRLTSVEGNIWQVNCINYPETAIETVRKKTWITATLPGNSDSHDENIDRHMYLYCMIGRKNQFIIDSQ